MSKPTLEILNEAPPHDAEAERWVVGSIIWKPSVLDEVGVLRPGDFHDENCRELFAALTEMCRAGTPIDGGTLVKRFRADEQWTARIAEILHAVPTPAHALHYAKIVAKNAKLRRLQDIAEVTLQHVHQADVDPDAVIERTESALGKLHLGNAGDGEPVTAREAAMQALARIDAIRERGKSAGLPTGISSFDSDQGGLFPGELTILAARPGVGKTSLALQIAHHNAERGRLVYFASLEMSAVELSIRLACGESGVSNRLVRIGKFSGDDSQRLSDALARQAKALLEIHDRSMLTVAAIRREIRKRKKRGVMLAIVDYLQLLAPEDRRLPREQQVARIVRSLKETAREYDIPILCLCQLNRQADGDETPRLSHLRESGAIEQDADVVLFLQSHEPKDGETHNAILTVAKNRNGETGPLRLHWDGARTRFSVPGYDEFAGYSGGSDKW